VDKTVVDGDVLPYGGSRWSLSG